MKREKALDSAATPRCGYPLYRRRIRMKMASYLTVLLAAVSFLPQVSGGVQILSKEALGDREVMIAPDYSRDKVVDRVTCDFEQSLDLSAAWGLTFEFRTDDISAFSGFVLLLRTGGRRRPAGWYVYRPHPEEVGENGWLRMTLEREPASTSGAPEGLDRISCIRFTGYLVGDRRPKEVRFRDFRVLYAKPKEKSADAHARAADQVRAIPPKAGERRLAWTRVELHGGEVPDWDALAARAKRVGITDLIPLLSWNGGAYFPSAVTGYRKELVEKHGDQLEKCLAACRRHGVKCHARKVNWRICGSKEFLERMRAEGRLQRVVAKSANGRAAGARSAGRRLVDGEWLCPGDPRNRKLEVDAMVELAAKGLDGIHYDYIRYEGYSGCYCDGCKARFEARIGRKVERWPDDVGSSNAPLVKEWDAYRRETISAVVEEVARRVHRDFPKVEISAAVQRFKPGLEPNAQDWSRWCRERWLDFVCPMDYTNLSVFLENTARPQKKVMDDTGVPIYPGIGLCSSSSKLTPLAAARQIELLRNMGFPGYTFFSFRADTYPDFECLAEGPCR